MALLCAFQLAHATCSSINMSLKWTDFQEIAIQLEETHPDADIVYLRFTDLWKWVQELPEFDDDPNKSNEKILEAIQTAWISEREEA